MYLYLVSTVNGNHTNVPWSRFLKGHFSWPVFHFQTSAATSVAKWFAPVKGSSVSDMWGRGQPATPAWEHVPTTSSYRTAAVRKFCLTQPGWPVWKWTSGWGRRASAGGPGSWLSLTSADEEGMGLAGVGPASCPRPGLPTAPTPESPIGTRESCPWACVRAVLCIRAFPGFQTMGVWAPSSSSLDPRNP